jgi:hypothetical protein
MNGTLLSSFTADGSGGYNLMTGVAMDNEDGTVWVVRAASIPAFATRLEQYSRTGALLGFVDDPAFQNFDSAGAEFPFSGSPCIPAITPAGQSFAAVGGLSFVAVAAGPGCGWTTASQAPWILVSAPTSGTGNNMVLYSVDVNTSSAPRIGTMTIGGQIFTVNQAASVCTVSMSLAEVTLPQMGATASIPVSAGPGCEWTAASQSSWITIISGVTGMGNGTVTYRVQPLRGQASRRGRLTIGGHTVSVVQRR